jgi:tetratricopeptide (TPR) repeat protein
VGALPVLEAAVQAAERAADDSLAARAAGFTGFVLGGWLGKPQEGRQWVELAEAIAERAGHDAAVDAAVVQARTVITAMLGHPDEAIALHDREIALFEKAYGERDPRVAMAIMNRGVTLATLGRPDRALPDLERSIALLVAATGPSNPHLDLPYNNLGAALSFLGRPEEARAAQEHALALQAGRPPGGLTVVIFGGLAKEEFLLGNYDAAIRIATRGLELATDAGENMAGKWFNMMVRADARGKKGDIAGRAEDCRTILAMQKAQGALVPDMLYDPDALACLGEVELASHRVDAALAYLEQSVGFEHRRQPVDLPAARFSLARALRVAGRDPARARDLAQRARDALSRMPAKEREIAEIDRWLEHAAAASAPGKLAAR